MNETFESIYHKRSTCMKLSKGLLILSQALRRGGGKQLLISNHLLNFEQNLNWLFKKFYLTTDRNKA